MVPECRRDVPACLRDLLRIVPPLFPAGDLFDGSRPAAQDAGMLGLPTPRSAASAAGPIVG